MFMTSIYETKILEEVWLIHAEQMSCFYNFIILRKKETPTLAFSCGKIVKLSRTVVVASENM